MIASPSPLPAPDRRAVALLLAASLTTMANAAISPALPGLEAYREERGRRYERCRTLAAERFPAFEALDGIEKRLLMKRCKAKRA